MTANAAPPRSPDPFALTEEERAVRDTAAQFAQRELAPTVAQRDEEERYDRALFDRMGELGLTGIPYPEQYGGAGLATSPGSSPARRSPPPTWAWRSASRSMSWRSSASCPAGPMSRRSASCRR